jgi:pyrroline-5-carboxylate reductase
MTELTGALLLMGCGRMGGALLDGWLARGVSPERVHIVEPNEEARGALADKGVRLYADGDALPADLAPQIALLAVKPQMMDQVIAPVARVLGAETVILSIAAGTTIGYFETHFGDQRAVIRVMPNTPAAVGRGVSVLVANAKTPEAMKSLAEDLMSAVGETAWVDDEDLINAVTAVSGGGPAYVFYLIECLAQAGVDAGLPEALSMQIARATVAGAGELVHLSDQPASALRKAVCSPGGTTLEAVKVLSAEDGLQPLMTKAVAAATRRSRELAGD